jgi:hypothetical protein
MAGRPRFDSRREQEIFLFAAASRLAVGPTQPPVQWVVGAIFPGVKGPGHEADHSLASNAEVKKKWNYTSTTSYIFMVWLSVSTRDNLVFL